MQTYQKREAAAAAHALSAQTEAPSPLSGGALTDGASRLDLPEAMRAKMENAFGADLSGVKLYQSERVAESGANAVAMGNSIAFAPGKFDMSSQSGQALLGHELSHVVSQQRGEVRGSGLLNDSVLEARADREGAMAAAGQQVYTGPVTPLSTTSSVASVTGPMQCKKTESDEKAINGSKKALGALTTVGELGVRAATLPAKLLDYPGKWILNSMSKTSQKLHDSYYGKKTSSKTGMSHKPGWKGTGEGFFGTIGNGLKAAGYGIAQGALHAAAFPLALNNAIASKPTRMMAEANRRLFADTIYKKNHNGELLDENNKTITGRPSKMVPVGYKNYKPSLLERVFARSKKFGDKYHEDVHAGSGMSARFANLFGSNRLISKETANRGDMETDQMMDELDMYNPQNHENDILIQNSEEEDNEQIY